MLAPDGHILEVAARQNANLASIRQRVDGGVDRRVLPHTVHAIADRNGAAATTILFRACACAALPRFTAIRRRTGERNDGQPSVMMVQPPGGRLVQLLHRTIGSTRGEVPEVALGSITQIGDPRAANLYRASESVLC